MAKRRKDRGEISKAREIFVGIPVIALYEALRFGKGLVNRVRTEPPQAQPGDEASPAVERRGPVDPDFSRARSVEDLVERTYTNRFLDAADSEDLDLAKRLLREMVRIGAQRENPLLPGMDEELRKRLIEQEIRSRLGDPTIRWITDSTNRVQAHCDFCGNYASPEIGCISCRSGNGPPRISPEEAIRITAEIYAGRRLTGSIPPVDEVLDTYRRYAHRQRTPVLIRRTKEGPAIIIWPENPGYEGLGGHVSISRQPYAEAMRKYWGRGEFSPGSIEPAGWRATVTSEGNVTVRKVSTARTAREEQTMTIEEWGRKSGFEFQSAVEWAPDLRPQRHLAKTAITDVPLERGETTEASEGTNNHGNDDDSEEGDPTIPTWSDLGVSDTEKLLLQRFGKERLMSLMGYLGYEMHGEDFSYSCPCCSSHIPLGGACRSCTDSGMIPPVGTIAEVARYLVSADEYGVQVSLEDAVDFATLVIGRPHEPWAVLLAELDGMPVSILLFDNGALFVEGNPGGVRSMEGLYPLEFISGEGTEAGPRVRSLVALPYWGQDGQWRFSLTGNSVISCSHGPDIDVVPVSDFQENSSDDEQEPGLTFEDLCSVLHADPVNSRRQFPGQVEFAGHVDVDPVSPWRRVPPPRLHRELHGLRESFDSKRLWIQDFWEQLKKIRWDKERAAVLHVTSQSLGEGDDGVVVLCDHCGSRVTVYGCSCDFQRSGPPRTTVHDIELGTRGTGRKPGLQDVAEIGRFRAPAYVLECRSQEGGSAYLLVWNNGALACTVVPDGWRTGEFEYQDGYLALPAVQGGRAEFVVRTPDGQEETVLVPINHLGQNMGLGTVVSINGQPVVSGPAPGSSSDDWDPILSRLTGDSQ